VFGPNSDKAPPPLLLLLLLLELAVSMYFCDV